MVSHPRRGNFGKRRVACGEPEKARGLLTGWSRTAGLSSGRWRPSPTTLSQPGRRGGSATTSWRSASRSAQECFACRTTAETWLRLVAWSAAVCRILHKGARHECVIIGDAAYESLTLHHNIYAHLASIFLPRGRGHAKNALSRPPSGRVSARRRAHRVVSDDLAWQSACGARGSVDFRA